MLLPTALLALVFPLHAMWFRGCVAGFVRRWRLRQAEASTVAVVVEGKGEKVGEAEVLSASGVASKL